MASKNGAASYGTGAELDAAGTRRRNVPGGSLVGGDIVVPALEDTKKQQKIDQAGDVDIEAIVAPIFFTLLSFFTRLYKIGQSNIVTWDEAHFGKFGSHYLKREFYFDVHPPLGKMLVGLSGWMAGYNGSFEFKSGEVYPEGLNYTFMRVFNATFGALCVPLAYFTAKELKLSKPAVWLVTLMVLCENSYATISRFILLDSMLLFFTFTTMLCFARFHRLQTKSFSPQWWLWLVLSGLSIGCVCSVKWVGLFVTGVVGLYTIEDLWNKFGDLKMPKIVYAQHWVARIIGLIVIPMVVYMWSFWMHFAILENSGPGDAQMSSLFQANLKGTDLTDSPLEIALGSPGNVNLPQWGFKQIEVTCTKKNNPRDVFTHWNVESHWNEKLPNADVKAFRSPFLRDFIHLNVAMMTSNNALVPDPDKQDDLASAYWQWPILHVGLRMCSWDDGIVKYFLLGNPMVYWGSTLALPLFSLLVLLYLIRWQRGYNDLDGEGIDHIRAAGIYPLIGWVFHYVPFIAMARVTYVHHYYPALYFAILVFGFLFNHLTNKLPKTAKLAVYGVAYVAITGVFVLFIPISFGMTGSSEQYKYLNWLPTWRI
ncbi:unnamed protein product [Tuber melanosporum]|uniref:Dolichyl-phosphate-mannose--protein mannosyltransferase n=1 Tax=Tuber melanosporum (strain Mel28) TaxID=656061 RepID=D5G7H7_TUBMM|nr:uncharacterized protein GSTUM_00002470001 [Tuber melanosporum]CAZ80470.1 unnamed protein product [Tuber melanosporum]